MQCSSPEDDMPGDDITGHALQASAIIYPFCGMWIRFLAGMRASESGQ
jgi:hypothetical protein